MKMVKSLLLGTAAGLVAVAGAQAADLPVKAKPVQYVKICSLYGAGFYYMPGTDTCLKVGGFVRAETMVNSGGSFSQLVDGNFDSRAIHRMSWRARAAITLRRHPVCLCGLGPVWVKRAGNVLIGLATFPVRQAARRNAHWV